jgi:hypothetical protein
MLDRPTLEEDAEAIDEFENEPIIWMAANGYLTEDEIERIEREAGRAARRIGTDDEVIGSAGADTLVEVVDAIRRPGREIVSADGALVLIRRISFGVVSLDLARRGRLLHARPRLVN